MNCSEDHHQNLCRIDEESPFWKMSPKDILSSAFEIIVTLDSVIESTGNTTQARSSYLPNEILWGFRFDNLISYAQVRVDMTNDQ